jgi:hypothetical protein
MSTVSDLECNLIDVPKTIPSGVSAWDLGVAQKLAEDIANKVDPLKINIRAVQPKDHLIPLIVGLSQGKLLPKTRGGDGTFEQLPITYLGDSEQIQKGKAGNPDQLAIKANLIEFGQYVALNREMNRVYIGDNVQQILTALKP